jgi:hypothetical protein
MSKTIRCHGCQACQPEPDLSYGSFLGGDPRTFSPDPECSTEAERALHKQHCQEWETGQQPAVPVSGLEPLPEYRTKDGRTIPAGAIAFVEQAVYGLGVSVVEWPKPICGGDGRIELWPGANGRRAWRNWLRSQRKHDKGSWAASLGVVRGRAAFVRRHRGSSAGQGIPEVPGMPPALRV